MFKKGDIIEYDDHGVINKVKLLSEVRFDYFVTPFGSISHTPGWHCTSAKHLEGRHAGKWVTLFCISPDCRLSVPFKIGKPIKKHKL